MDIHKIQGLQNRYISKWKLDRKRTRGLWRKGNVIEKRGKKRRRSSSLNKEERQSSNLKLANRLSSKRQMERRARRRERGKSRRWIKKIKKQNVWSRQRRKQVRYWSKMRQRYQTLSSKSYINQHYKKKWQILTWTAQECLHTWRQHR